jgi:hypothetical protein
LSGYPHNITPEKKLKNKKRCKKVVKSKENEL